MASAANSDPIKALLKTSFGPTFFGFAAVAACAGAAVYVFHGPEVLRASLRHDVDTALQILPNFICAMFMATFILSLVPKGFLERLVGEGSGFKGMLIGSAAGAATPGGPMASFPLVVVLRNAGAGRAPLISYLTAWSTMGIHRILVWEIQLIGVEFALVRVLASAPLGLIAGFLSHFFPPSPAPEEAGPPVKQQ